jgi:hypothetical protein
MRSPGSGSSANPTHSSHISLGRRSWGVRLLGPGEDTVLHCYMGDLYDGERLRPERLAAWRALRERYGNRDESRVDEGTLQVLAA